MRWKAQEAVTSCGGLRSGTGFIAYGQQKGVALGFWGLGFTFSLPPLMGVYGLVGYALFATVDADGIEFYPPNSPPVISQIDPGDGEINVPLSLFELRFQISDYDSDLMSYTVATTPDVGSGSGDLNPDGVYSVPISGLEDLTEYSWHIEVTDGMDTTIDGFTFTTEAIAPIVSNPSPHDGERNVPVDISYLSFHLKDFQGDLMDYTVETVPDIGSGSGTGVSEGTYTIPISGLDYSVDYTWYITVTDGEHETDKIFDFKTRPIPASWWNDDWSNRKEIFVDYSKVEGELDNFPILIDISSDSDLSVNAQEDGDDIVFTDYSGTKLNHEIEVFDNGNGKLTAWANVPSLTSDSILYMYYGNSGCSNQQNIEGTWSSDYTMVQHFEEATGTHYDSTSNNHDSNLINVFNQDASGKIAGADDFEADQINKIDFPDSPDWDFETNPVTISYWAKMESDRYIAWGYHGLNLLYHYGVNKLYITINQDNSLEYVWTYELNTWYNIVYTREGDEHKIYIDGYLVDVENNGAGFRDVDVPFQIGTWTGENDGYRMDGIIDEFRILNVCRSQDWIMTSYLNQDDPSSLIEVGPEEFSP